MYFWSTLLRPGWSPTLSKKPVKFFNIHHIFILQYTWQTALRDLPNHNTFGVKYLAQGYRTDSNPGPLYSESNALTACPLIPYRSSGKWLRMYQVLWNHAGWNENSKQDCKYKYFKLLSALTKSIFPIFQNQLVPSSGFKIVNVFIHDKLPWARLCLYTWNLKMSSHVELWTGTEMQFYVLILFVFVKMAKCPE